MSSINTNQSALNALATLRDVNNNLGVTQERISTGSKVNSAKDNAAYFSISGAMKGDSAIYSAINEGLTLTKNSLATGRLGAETFADLATKISEKVGFAQSESMDHESVDREVLELLTQMKTVIDQSTFNGESWVDGKKTGSNAVDVVTGISRATNFETTTRKVEGVDLEDTLTQIAAAVGITYTAATDTDPVKFEGTGLNGMGNATARAAAMKNVEAQLGSAIEAATTLGLAEKSISDQQEFLKKVTTTIDTGVGAMVDADMEEEAARLQALQVQQQLATQALSIANQGPQNLLSLFR